ncbi:MAG: MFS transporter [Ktedonobacteraceae bacterium]
MPQRKATQHTRSGMRLGGLVLAGLAIALHVTNYGAMIPAIRADLHVSAGQVGLLSTVLFIGVGLAYPLGGWLSDRYGPRWILVGSLFCIGSGGILTAMIPDLTWMLLCRGIVGVGIGIALVAGSQAAVALGQQGTALGQGLFGGATQAGAALGIILPPLVQTMAGWRVALESAGLPALAVSVLWFLLPEERSPRRTQGFARIIGALRTPSIWLLGVMLLGTLGLGQAMAPWLPLLLVSTTTRVPLTLGATTAALVLLIGACLRILGGVVLVRGLLPPMALIRGATVLACVGMGLLALPLFSIKVLGSLLLIGGTCAPFAAIFGEANRAGQEISLGAGTVQGTISMISAPGAALGPAAIGFLEHSPSLSLALVPVALLGAAACLAAFLYPGLTGQLAAPEKRLPRKEPVA